MRAWFQVGLRVAFCIIGVRYGRSGFKWGVTLGFQMVVYSGFKW